MKNFLFLSGVMCYVVMVLMTVLILVIPDQTRPVIKAMPAFMGWLIPVTLASSGYFLMLIGMNKRGANDERLSA